MTVACEEAHHAGVRVAAHAEGAEGVRNVILAGVDSIEHGHGIDERLVDLMLERGVTLVPTIQSDSAILDRGREEGVPAFMLEKCRSLAALGARSLELCIEAGVLIVAGNDGGATFVHPSEIVDELELYGRHGMSTLAALASATTTTAALCGFDSVGLFEPGHRADLLLVEGDPLVDIGHLRRPGAVFGPASWRVAPMSEAHAFSWSGRAIGRKLDDNTEDGGEAAPRRMPR